MTSAKLPVDETCWRLRVTEYISIKFHVFWQISGLYLITWKKVKQKLKAKLVLREMKILEIPEYVKVQHYFKSFPKS